MSWLWGLGFFYSIHVVQYHGWLGFLSFAIPNAIGLAGFGILVDRWGARGDLERPFMRLAASYSGALLTYQLLAIGITAFAFYRFMALPLLGDLALPAVALVALAGMACGQAFDLGNLKRLHVVYAGVGILCAATVPHLMPNLPGSSWTPVLDANFAGLLVPTLVGFLLGPWLDIQHWHRAVRIRREGSSAALAYAGGGLLFLGMITLNAVASSGLPTDLNGMAFGGSTVNFAGRMDFTPAMGAALTQIGGVGTSPALLFLVWAAVAMASTLDSGWSATRWLLTGVTGESKNPLLAMVPNGLVVSPLPLFLGAAVIAAVGVASRLSLLDLMAPYATFFVGYAVCLALQVLRGARTPDTSLCALLGAASAVLFAIGFYGYLPILTTVAPLVALLAALPLLWHAPVPALAAPAPEAAERVSGTLPGTLVIPAPAAEPGELSSTKGHFDGEWFNLAYTPTYDDTNSVGNIYWANYLRWVGKTREIFFSRCLPDFDLKTTTFFILTKDVAHSFMSEAKEFEPCVIRMRVGKNNRKFATLEHRILTQDGRLLGKGQQQLMFVDSQSYKLIDIPPEVFTGFLPYMPAAKAAS